MAKRKTWHVAMAILVIALLHADSGRHTAGPSLMPNLGKQVFAGVGVVDDNGQFLFTASQDGRKIYIWKLDDAKLPKFVGSADAVLSQ